MPINRTPTWGPIGGFFYEYAKPGRTLLKASKKARKIYEEVFEKVSQLTHSYALEWLKIYIDFEGQTPIYCKQAIASHFRAIEQWQTFGPLEVKIEDFKVLRVGPIEISLSEIKKILSPKAWVFSKPRKKFLKGFKGFAENWGPLILPEIPKDIEFVLVCAVWAGSFGIYSNKFMLKGYYGGYFDTYEGASLASFFPYLSKEKARKFEPVIEDPWDDV